MPRASRRTTRAGRGSLVCAFSGCRQSGQGVQGFSIQPRIKIASGDGSSHVRKAPTVSSVSCESGTMTRQGAVMPVDLLLHSQQGYSESYPPSIVSMPHRLETTEPVRPSVQLLRQQRLSGYISISVTSQIPANHCSRQRLRLPSPSQSSSFCRNPPGTKHQPLATGGQAKRWRAPLAHPREGSLLALLGSQALGPDRKGVRNVRNADVDGVGRDRDPDKVEKEQVEPEIHPVASVEVDVVDQPFRAESHPGWSCTQSQSPSAHRNSCIRGRGRHTSVEFCRRQDDHRDVGPRVSLDDVVAHQDGHRANHEYGEKLEAHDALAPPGKHCASRDVRRADAALDRHLRDGLTTSAPPHRLSARA